MRRDGGVVGLVADIVMTTTPTDYLLLRRPFEPKEMSVSARKGERSPDRTSYRSGYYSRGLMTRVGKLELQVPQD